MNKNDVFTCEISGYTSEGLGVARADGLAVFVPQVIEGEKCEVRIEKVLKNRAYGKAVSVIEPSSERIQPLCPVFGACGGCDFWHMSYEEELRLKGKRIDDALRRLGGFEGLAAVTVTPSPDTLRYRNKAQFPVRQVNGKAAFGFFRPRSRDIVPVDDCIIQTQAANDICAAVCLWANQNGVKCYDDEKGTGFLRHVLVRTGQGGAHVCIVASGGDIGARESLIQAVTAAHPNVCGITLNINPSRTNVIMGEKSVTLYGEGALRDSLCGLDFDISPHSFYQVNHAVAQIMYEHIAQLAVHKDAGPVLDLYCGIGTITLVLAQSGAQAYGAEIVPQAIDNARKNAQLNGIKNASFYCMDAGECAKKLLDEGIRPEAVVCDPPRKGMDSEAIDATLSLEPRRIIYVACDPSALARDAKKICEAGYEIKSVRGFDMFPRTANVETVVLLSKLKSTTSIEVKIDLDEMDLTKSESKATYDEIKQYVLDKFGFKVSQLYIAQVKRKHGIIERDNYNTGEGGSLLFTRDK